MVPNYSYTTNPITANCTVIASFAAIISVPDAPTIGTTIAGDGQATISFTPPANDGGSAVILPTRGEPDPLRRLDRRKDIDRGIRAKWK